MISTTLKNLLVILCVAALLGCDKTNPVGPSGVPGTFDEKKPVDDNNRPPGPGPNVKAIFDYAVYGYDCVNVPESCDSARKLEPVEEEIEGRETYNVKLGSSHTVVMCVVHPGFPALRLAPGWARAVTMSVSASASSQSGLAFFYEGDEANRGIAVLGGYRKCVASTRFNNTLPDMVGRVRGHESGGDIIHDFEETRINIALAFRVMVIR